MIFSIPLLLRQQVFLVQMLMQSNVIWPAAESNEPNSKAYLFQQISVAVQRGKAALDLGCAGLDLDEV